MVDGGAAELGTEARAPPWVSWFAWRRAFIPTALPASMMRRVWSSSKAPSSQKTSIHFALPTAAGMISSMTRAT